MKHSLRVKLWDAINSYAESCGGDTSAATTGSCRMGAVVAVEQVIREIERDAEKSAKAKPAGTRKF